MNSIRTHLIHLLGGLTITESQQSYTNSFNVGRYSAFQSVLAHMRDNYGKDWRNSLYSFVRDSMDLLESS